MELLKIKDIYKLEMAKFMHSYFNDKLPENLKNFFTSAKNLHSHSTRSINNQNYYLDRVNIQGSNTLCNYSGVKLWNKIPLNKNFCLNIYFQRVLKMIC